MCNIKMGGNHGQAYFAGTICGRWQRYPGCDLTVLPHYLVKMTDGNHYYHEECCAEKGCTISYQLVKLNCTLSKKG